MKQLLLFVALFIFSIVSFAGTITITSPNGSEVWAGCTQRIITWNASGVSNNYNIDYSINNGASWISVASNLNIISPQQYNWTVPNISSTSCLVRVSDASAPTTFDVSNLTFSITAPLMLLIPNGGETWQGGTNQTISFVASGTTNYYDILYSVNAGANYTSIASNVNITNGQYNWLVPNNPSASCLIKIQDKTNFNCMVDISDALFTITPATPVITVTNPNTSLTYYVGGSANITWTSAYVTSNAVKIDYSTNNGTSWTPVVTNTTNSGSYSWTIPNTPSTQCLIKVTDLGNPATFDVSNTSFTIASPFITVTSPNGGESYTGCTNQTITWSYGGTGTYASVKYSTDNGSTWTVLTNTATAGSYSWTNMPSISSSQCLVKVNDVNNTSIKDSSNAVFTIVPNTDVVVTSPNGTESWQVGTNQTIVWASAPTSTRFNTYYSTNNGSSWTSISTYLSGQSSNWIVPNFPASTCLVKVEDYSNTCKFDVSNANFTITPPNPVITVTNPNSTNTYYVGASTSITWSSQYLTTNYIKLEYSTNGGLSWSVIASQVQNNGSYSWTIPATPSTQCRVRASDFYNSATFDISDVNFTIANPFITVGTPNGGETWTGCSSQTITWSYGGTGTYASVKYSTDNGTTWTTLTNSATGGSYTWNPVPSMTSTQALIKVNDASNASIKDSSNNVFTINPNTDLILTAPNGGENWTVGTNQNITWAGTGSRFNTYYSTNNGTSWTQISNYITGFSSTWNVANFPSTNALVKVEDYNNTCKFDVSNAVFTIAPPSPVITVTNPNSASTFYVGGTTNITWSTQYLTTNFMKLELSTNGGTSWTTIASPVNNNGSYSWTIPSSPSTQCRVRVSDYYNAATYDVSDVNFTIANPFITVTSPNGNESWTGCSVQTITWSYGGTGTYASVKYSTDSGVNWTVLTNSATGGSYSWNPVPSLSSSQCLVRVNDVNNTAIKDSSNANFTLVPNTDVIVTSPNGNESWQTGTNQTITWVSAPTSTRFNTYYSTNAGTTWTSISTYLSGNSQTWNVPNFPSTNCLIKVEDYSNNCKFDISNANFTIAPPAPVITVTSPNNAATYYVGSTTNITWTTQFLTTNYMKIEYTTNAGSTWNVIANPAQNNGSYSWTIPATPSTQCRVRVSDFYNASTFDISDVNFTIANPFIVVTSPNGNENWKGCTSKTITWNYGGTGTYASIKYSTDNGSNWTNITNSASGGAYTWNPVPSIGSSQCLIKISDINNPSVKDSSNTVFTLQANADIAITTPNGGESWQVGTSQNINWVSEPTSTRFNIYYSTNNGSAWTQIANYSNAHTQAWTVPNYPSGTNLVKVEDYNNTCIYDVSDAQFIISPPNPVITVTAPNTANTYYVGNSTTISWTSAYLTSSFVKIEYSADNGATWILISSPVQNSGSYSWLIPNNISSQCLVRISEYNNPAVFDISNLNFSIAAPYITVLSPNGGETFEGCTSQNISFSYAGTSGSFIMKYSTNNGISWTNAGSTSGSPFSWSTVPNISSTQCLVKILDYNNNNIKDSSNALFSIVQNNDVIITAPNGGEQWQVATSHNITWVSDPSSTAFVVSYSADNGSSWSVISSYTTAHSISWTIPNNPGSNYLIKVEDYYNSCKKDQTDAQFIVTPQPPRVTSPNGGETRYYGSSYNITWTSQYFNSTYVKIDLSVDSGLTWSPITSVTNNTGTYSWSCPNSFSNKCLVKVSEYGNSAAFDISDATFTIAPGMVITSPNGDNGNEEWRVCTLTSLQWTAGGGSGSYKIEYSTNNGNTWTTITSAYSAGSSTCSYDWTLPNSPSTQCLLRVTDNTYPLKTDISDATWTIKPSIEVTSPNGGQSLTVGSTYNVTWTSLGASGYYDLEYSTNGGGTWTNFVFNTLITSNTYAWTVPSAASTNCYVRITDHVNTCKTDMSNNSFSIGMPAPTINITSLNGGETVNSCSATTISWTASSTSGSYIIEYSTNNGQTWNTIISNYTTAGGTYSWTVPNISSSQCLVRVKDYSNNTISDASNAVFTINPTISATITPGGPTSFCAGNSVTLTSSSATGNVWSPGGQTSQSITVSTSGNYNVAVTNAGCTATSNVVNVTVNAVPSAPVATSNSPVALNGNIQLNASTVPNASYTWTGPLSFTSNLQNPTIQNALQTMSGTYSVIASVGGCNSSAGTVSVTVSATPATAIISGNIISETGLAVNGATIAMTGATTGSFNTTANGQYNFTMNLGGNYTLTPSKNNDVTTNNGVSTLDILLTQRHILNMALLNSPYKIIAADVNKSGTVTSLDLVLMRSLILQTATSFPNNQLWSFVNSSYVFSDVNNPFPFEGTRSYSSATPAADQNFIAVKLGDVNNSWDNHIAKSGNAGAINITLDNISAVQGEEVIVPVRVSDFNNISGYQFTLTWDPTMLEFVDVNNSALSGFFNTSKSGEGKLATMWTTDDATGIDLTNGTSIFELKMRLTAGAGITSNISINSTMIGTEAYNGNLEALAINQTGGSIASEQATDVKTFSESGYSLSQNSPNPFSNFTEIRFAIPSEEKVIFKIYNYLGEVVSESSAVYQKGENSIAWNSKNNSGINVPSGTYYIRMEAGRFVAIRKMVVIK